VDPMLSFATASSTPGHENGLLDIVEYQFEYYAQLLINMK